MKDIFHHFVSSVQGLVIADRRKAFQKYRQFNMKKNKTKYMIKAYNKNK